MAALSLNLPNASAIPPAGRRPLHLPWQPAAHQLQHLLEPGGLGEHMPQTPTYTRSEPEHLPFPGTVFHRPAGLTPSPCACVWQGVSRAASLSNALSAPAPAPIHRADGSTFLAPSESERRSSGRAAAYSSSATTCSSPAATSTRTRPSLM
jgi:hypothetical protein